MKHPTTTSKQNLADRKNSDELILANRKLATQNKEKEKRATELIVANKELKKADEEHQKEYIGWLEEMMFMTSHRVRQPIARIIGVSTILDTLINSHHRRRAPHQLPPARARPCWCWSGP